MWEEPSPLTPQSPLPEVEGEQEKESEHVADRYIIHNNGTVTDTVTNLMWKRCSEGQYGADCKVEVQRHNWYDTMSKFGKGVSFAGYNDWRVPTIEELRPLVDESQHPTIDQTAFPNTAASYYWSSSEKNTSNVLSVYFYDGSDVWCHRYDIGQVRLVRSVQ